MKHARKSRRGTEGKDPETGPGGGRSSGRLFEFPERCYSKIHNFEREDRGTASQRWG